MPLCDTRKNARSSYRTDAVVLKAEHAHQKSKDDKFCDIQESNFHSLQECRQFLFIPYSGRVSIVKKGRFYFRRFGEHFIKDCCSNIACKICEGTHHFLLHDNDRNYESVALTSNRSYAGAVPFKPTSSSAAQTDNSAVSLCSSQFM